MNKKLLIKALHDNNLAKVQELISHNPQLLNMVLSEPLKPKSKKISLNYTPLGYAIFLGHEQIVNYLLSLEEITLNVGNVLAWIKDAENFARHLKKDAIVDLIIAYKLQNNLQNLTLDHAPTIGEAENSLINNNLAQQIYQYLLSNQLEQAEQASLSLANNLPNQAQAEELALKLIDELTLTQKHARWIIRGNKTEQIYQQGRDSMLNENLEQVVANQALLAKKTSILYSIIYTLCPQVKDLDHAGLQNFYNQKVTQAQHFFAEDSDDSDDEDHNLLVDSAVPTARFKRASNLKNIKNVLEDGWLKGAKLREKLTHKLNSLVADKQLTDKNIDSLNQEIFSQKRPRQVIKEATKQQSNLFVAQFRGINYMPDRWNMAARRYHYSVDETSCAQFSESVLKQLSYNFYTNLSEEQNYFANSTEQQFLMAQAQMAKQRYQQMQNSQPLVEECVALNNKPYVFNNLSEFLQSGYTNGISDHLLEIKRYRSEKIGEIDKATLNSFNYEISTSDCPTHALRYALGLKKYYADNFVVRYHKDGRVVNSHVGKVYIILQKLEEFNQPQVINHVLRMAHEARVPIMKVGGVDIANELENDYIGYIPGEKVVYQLNLKFPSFAKPYKAIYEVKYGLNQELYDLFANLLKDSWHESPHNPAHLAAIELLKEWLCYYYEGLLLQIAQQQAINLNGELVYVRHDGTPSNTPDFVPLNPGLEHIATRHRVHVLQDFRLQLAKHILAHNLQYTGDIQKVIKQALADDVKILAQGIKLDDNPEAFSKIRDQDAKQFYAAEVLPLTDEVSKRTEITRYVLQRYQHTLPLNTTVPTPLIFRKRSKPSTEEQNPTPKLKSSRLSS